MQHKGTRILTTDRLILRPFRIEDASAMYNNWAGDPEVTKFLTWPPHASAEVTKALLTDWVSRYEDPAYYNWAITLKGNDEPIGNISVVQIKDNVSEAHIGYCMSRALWRRGIMPEALSAVMDYLFDVGFLRISAGHDVNNPASGRVMEKAGMKYEGCMRQAGRDNQGIVDIILRAALRDEYLKEKGLPEG